MLRIIQIIFLLNFLSASIIEIPTQYRTIQGGIDHSSQGDTVLVQPGIYYENLQFVFPHGITLSSNFLLTSDTSYISQTIINGDQNGNVINIDGWTGDESNLIITGFTITNGYATSGGGVQIINRNNVYLDHLHVINNSASMGGGIFSTFSSNVQITNTLVDNNIGIDWAGGIYFYSSSDGGVENCTIQNNESGMDGGGITIAGGPVEISNSQISYNTAHRDGGGLFATPELDQVISLNNVLVSNNTTTGVFDFEFWYNGGGGIALNMCQLELINTTIADNNTASLGHNLLLQAENQVSISNSIIWDTQEGQIYSGYESNVVIVGWSDISSDDSTFVNPNNAEWIWGDGNIQAEPMFFDPATADYSLQYGSPCIDAGDPESPYDPDGTTIDMGAFYFDQDDCDNYEYLLCDGNQDGWVDVLDVVMLVGFILGNVEGSPIYDCIFDGNGDGIVDILDLLSGCMFVWIPE